MGLLKDRDSGVEELPIDYTTMKLPDATTHPFYHQGSLVFANLPEPRHSG